MDAKDAYTLHPTIHASGKAPMSEKINRREFLPLAGAGETLKGKVFLILTVSAIGLSSITGCSTQSPPTTIDHTIDLPGTIVFSSNNGANVDLYMSRFDGEQAINLTPDTYESEENYPIWVDNGQKIVFVSDRDGNPELYRINNVQNPETSLEQLTDLDGKILTSPELFPGGNSVLFFYQPGDNSSLNQLIKLDLSTGLVEHVADVEGTYPEIRFIDEDNVLRIGNPAVNVVNLPTGTETPYLFNHSEKEDNFELSDVATIDVSAKTGRGYMSINHKYNFDRPGWFRVFSWDHLTMSDYKVLTDGAWTDKDAWRDFRVEDMGGNKDYVIGATRIYRGGAQTAVPLHIGPWEIGVWIQEDNPNKFGFREIPANQSGDNRHPDWTMVEHITPVSPEY
ncbi:TolB family protein [Gemmatimonadota bacterium]